MYPLQYIELTVTILGISLTVTNVILANLSAVFPLLLTKVLDNGYSFPNNPLGPQFFPKGTECLDLIIVNSGPGTARNVKWEISRSDREGKDNGALGERVKQCMLKTTKDYFGCVAGGT